MMCYYLKVHFQDQKVNYPTFFNFLSFSGLLLPQKHIPYPFYKNQHIFMYTLCFMS